MTEVQNEIRKKAIMTGFNPQGAGIHILDHSNRVQTVFNENLMRFVTLVDGVIVDECQPETVQDFDDYMKGKEAQI